MRKAKDTRQARAKSRLLPVSRSHACAGLVRAHLSCAFARGQYRSKLQESLLYQNCQLF